MTAEEVRQTLAELERTNPRFRWVVRHVDGVRVFVGEKR